MLQTKPRKQIDIKHADLVGLHFLVYCLYIHIILLRANI